ncbi:hypothetical protein [Formosa haliotis]|uniref:hypothetical protein n=1 Tax=Formosa haliotis TaxID=1555194 RepID=UPI000824EB14|nr:hypothetical protein [Formosa haliotis]
MKSKILTSLGVIAIALSLFFNSNSITKGDTDLSSLIALNVANAEDGPVNGCRYTGNWEDTCSNLIVVQRCVETTVPYADSCNV